MATLPSPASPERNRLLLALPPADYAALLPDLHPVALARGAVLFEAHARIRHVYFPQRCVVSLLTPVDDEPAVEVGLVGNEGMVGLSVFLGGRTSTLQAVLQVPDGAWRMTAAAFVRALARGPALHRIMQAYARTVIGQVTQGLACNQRHLVGQRCARWLLMAHDRVGADRFLLTQEFLGQMLGRAADDRLARRPAAARAGRDPVRARSGHGARPRGAGGGRLRLLRARTGRLRQRVRLTRSPAPPTSGGARSPPHECPMSLPDPAGGPRAPAQPARPSDALVASAAWRAALDEAARAAPPARASSTIRRWEDDGGASATPLWSLTEVIAHAQEVRRADGVRERADDAVAEVVRAYARELRRAGVPLPAILRAIAVAVRGLPASAGARDRAEAFMRDAARSGIAAYYGP
jgi:CRP-like cAMP-binding protein